MGQTESFLCSHAERGNKGTSAMGTFNSTFHAQKRYLTLIKPYLSWAEC